MTSRRRAVALAILLFASVAFRVAIALSFSTSSPDGDQYYALSQSLLRDGRYAYGPPPASLTYTRLPGYPILTAILDGKPRSRVVHVQRAALANAVFDTVTALLLTLILVAVDGGCGAELAIAGMVFCPLIVLQSVAALTESFAMLLGTLQLWLLIGLWRGQRGRASAAGAVAGIAQLVRLDALTLLPATILAVVWSPGSAARRARAGAAFVLTAMLLFSPWPIRNLIQFGHAHPQAAEWLNQAGQPLPAGCVRWMGTWSRSAPGESLLSDLIVFGRPFSAATPGVILPQMADTPEELKAVIAVVNHVGRSGPDAGADAEFIRLAQVRSARHPFRTYVQLPLERLPQLLLPPARATIHWVKIPLLGWPDSYSLFPLFYVLVYLLAPLGTAFLVHGGQWRMAALLWVTVGTRIALYSFAVPHQVSSRYFVEAFPMLILLAAYSVGRLGRLGLRLWRSRVSSAP
jgi:hypothetical protein